MWITLKPENEKTLNREEFKVPQWISFFKINDVKLPEGLCSHHGIPVKGGHGLNVDDFKKLSTVIF